MRWGFQIAALYMNSCTMPAVWSRLGRASPTLIFSYAVMGLPRDQGGGFVQHRRAGFGCHHGFGDDKNQRTGFAVLLVNVLEHPGNHQFVARTNGPVIDG